MQILVLPFDSFLSDKPLASFVTKIGELQSLFGGRNASSNLYTAYPKSSIQCPKGDQTPNVLVSEKNIEICEKFVQMSRVSSLI